jgi:hypothetical protein
MTYKAKDRVVDKNGAVWQYNALYGTWSCVQDKQGIVPCSDYYSSEALDKKFGPFTKYEEPKPQTYKRRFEVTVERADLCATVYGVENALTGPGYFYSPPSKVTVKELPTERRVGVDDRRVHNSLILPSHRPSQGTRALVRPFQHACGRRSVDQPWWDR